jgi:hypothetical protein
LSGKLPLFAALAAADFSPALQGWVSEQGGLRRVATLETSMVRAQFHPSLRDGDNSFRYPARFNAGLKSAAANAAKTNAGFSKVS